MRVIPKLFRDWKNSVRKVLVAHSYFLRFDPKSFRQMKPYPPLGTLYIAAVLRNAGFEVRLFDPVLSQSEEEIESHVKSFNPDVTLFFEDNFNYLSKMCLLRMRHACFRMASIAKRHGSYVIVQGSDPVDHSAEYFSHGVDVIVCGEGELTVPELLEAIPDGDLRSVNGIAYPTRDGVMFTPKRALISDLDALPFPAWDLVDMDAYRDAWRRHGVFSLNLVTTRGCPFHCNWCAKPIYGQVYNSRSPENVVREMQFLRESFAPDHLWFSDDILGLKPGWLKRFSELVDEMDCRIPFTCQTRVDLMLKEDNVANIARAGAETVWIGAESGSQKILDAMEKGTTIDEIRSATALLKAHNVRVAWFLQFGYPDEGEWEIQQTLALLRECKPDDIGISVSYPLPGTKFYERVRAQLGTKQNWIDSGDLDLIFPGAFHPTFYRSLHKAVHHEFRLRQGVRSLFTGAFRAKDLRHIAAIQWHAAQLVVHRVAMFFARRRKPIHPPLLMQPAS